MIVSPTVHSIYTIQKQSISAYFWDYLSLLARLYCKYIGDNVLDGSTRVCDTDLPSPRTEIFPLSSMRHANLVALF